MRTIELKIRFSEEELATIDHKRGRVRRAVYLRAAGLGVKPPRPVPQPTADALIALARVGNNLNQIARQLNAGGAAAQLIEVAEAEAQLLRNALAEISEQIEA